MHQPLLNRTPTPPASDIYHTSFVDIRRTTCSHRNSPRHSPLHPEHALPTRLRQLRLALRVENSRSTTRLNGSPLRLGVTRRPTDQECPAIARTFPGAIGPWELHTSQKPSESPAPWVAEPRAARRARGEANCHRNSHALQAIRPLNPGFGSAVWQGSPARAATRHINDQPSGPPDSPPNDEESRNVNSQP
jgi:hypothetical protein